MGNMLITMSLQLLIYNLCGYLQESRVLVTIATENFYIAPQLCKQTATGAKFTTLLPENISNLPCFPKVTGDTFFRFPLNFNNKSDDSLFLT